MEAANENDASGAKKTTPEVLWVRIKPVNKQKGQRLRRYRCFSMQFDEARGWHKVPRFVAGMVSGREENVDLKAYLSQVRNDPENPDSALAFDVCNAAQAREIEDKERKAIEAKRKSSNPVDLTSSEVRATGGTEPAPRRPVGRPRTRQVDE